jgi:two-component system, OmpR family, osmolarity sensor histidine kinase EnvZ
MPKPKPPALGLTLFSRTFFLLALLLGAGIFAWVQTLRSLELEPRAVQAAQQVASIVTLSREILRFTDPINQAAVTKMMSDRESLQVKPREPGDRWEPFEVDRFTKRVGAELRSRLEPNTVIARSVNGNPGLWVGFSIDKNSFWLQADRARVEPLTQGTWFVWVGIALGVTLICSIMIARLINAPLRELSFAASRIREGDFDSVLDENTLTSEIREVNVGFNRMARELAKVEEDRAVMLAGISHDLRTPLARLRLEVEMSQLARPGDTKLVPVNLAKLVEKEIATFREPKEIRIVSRLAIDLRVMADDIELGRVFGNLFENARRYGRGTDTGIAVVNVSYARSGPWIIVSVRDHGPGVAPEKLAQLTTPFYRGDAARTAATGAGLGLAIVEKAIQRMGGQFDIDNAPDGGLLAHIRLKRVP